MQHEQCAIELQGEHSSADATTSRTGDADNLIRLIRRAAKSRRRAYAWIASWIAVSIAATLFMFSRFDTRLSLVLFGASAGLIAIALTRDGNRWRQNALLAASMGDIRAIGPLLTVLNERDSSATDAIEDALIDLLPGVERLDQLSTNARMELNRLLLDFEMPGLRGGHNAELARVALELVGRLQVCSSLQAVRRLADGFTATRPAAVIRDLATDMLPELELRAGLLRASGANDMPARAYLRPAHTAALSVSPDQLLRPCDSAQPLPDCP